MKNKKMYLNPEGLSKNLAFSQIVATQGQGKTIYIEGQNALNENGDLIGKGDVAVQTQKVMRNLETALKSVDTGFEDLVKLNINIVQGEDLSKGFEVSQKFLGQISEPPAVTVLFVAGLANPEFLIEIDAIAFIPE